MKKLLYLVAALALLAGPLVVPASAFGVWTFTLIGDTGVWQCYPPGSGSDLACDMTTGAGWDDCASPFGVMCGGTVATVCSGENPPTTANYYASGEYDGEAPRSDSKNGTYTCSGGLN